MAYRVTIKVSADKSLDKIPKPIQARIVAKSAALADDPRPPGCTKLAGGGNLWRVRVGEYRIVYGIDDGKQVVDVQVIGHRREVYRGM